MTNQRTYVSFNHIYISIFSDIYVTLREAFSKQKCKNITLNLPSNVTEIHCMYNVFFSETVGALLRKIFCPQKSLRLPLAIGSGSA